MEIQLHFVVLFLESFRRYIDACISTELVTRLCADVILYDALGTPNNNFSPSCEFITTALQMIS
jgi:hypothetical protein